MRVYITCELDKTTGYIKHLDPYDTIESAINRAKVIIDNKMKMYDYDIDQRNDYLKQFEAATHRYLCIGFIYQDRLGNVRIIVKDM